MITFKRLEWDNCFSYGKDNSIDLDKNFLTQLVGMNGAGKTTISLMIQEVLYNKNIKNIKKQDIANNKTGEKGYSIRLFFEKDGIDYIVDLDRKTTLKLKLYKNNVDISSHNSLSTYKTLSEIIGISDFKTFTQLIYQHSTDSLEFLTATDMNRKKFLINLLQLEKYTELHDKFKELVREGSSDILSIKGSISTISAWIKDNESLELIKKELIPLPILRERVEEKIYELINTLKNISYINRKISTNNTYIAERNVLDPKYYLEPAPSTLKTSSIELRTNIKILNAEICSYQNKLNKLEILRGECPTCFQKVNIEEHKQMLKVETDCITNTKTEVRILEKLLTATIKIERTIDKYDYASKEFERLSQLIDSTLSTKTVVVSEIQEELKKLQAELKEFKDVEKSIKRDNDKIITHNSKVEVVKEQLLKMKVDLNNKQLDFNDQDNLVSILELLKKIFSTNGLVSYKIESSIKELEKEINRYLAELTYFQLYFKLSGEKLNIEITDDLGNSMSITNLSSGEKARVNVATILAIRSTLSSLTSTKINILILDEIINTIDATGREKLIEILLKENLNSFIVAHEWTHPLVPRVNIVKERGISRIENG